MSLELKRGWNWEFRFTEEVQPDGARKTLVVEYQLHHSKYETNIVISNYPGGHPYEDDAIEAIGIAFRDFFQEAHAAEVSVARVRVRTYFDAWLVDASVDSNLIRSFAADLAAINRVSVIMPDDAGEAAE